MHILRVIRKENIDESKQIVPDWYQNGVSSVKLKIILKRDKLRQNCNFSTMKIQCSNSLTAGIYTKMECPR